MKAIPFLLLTAALGSRAALAQDAPLEATPPVASESVYRGEDAAGEFDLTLKVEPLGGERLGNDEFELALIDVDPVPAAFVFASGFEPAAAPTPFLILPLAKDSP